MNIINLINRQASASASGNYAARTAATSICPIEENNQEGDSRGEYTGDSPKTPSPLYRSVIPLTYAHVPIANPPAVSEAGLAASAAPSRKSVTSKAPGCSTKLSQHIPSSQLIEGWNAYRFAEMLGTPLNTFVSIDYVHHELWIPGTRKVKEQQRMEASVKQAVQHTLSDFCKRNGFAYRAVSVIENTPDGGHGLHTHILMHLPPKRWHDLQQKLTSCLCKRFKKTVKGYQRLQAEKDAASTAEAKKRVWLPFYITPSQFSPGGPLTSQEAQVKLAYMCKGADPSQSIIYRGQTVTLAELMERDQFALQPAGNARTRRRMGSTRNLGKKARKAAGWIDDQGLERLSKKVRFDELKAQVLGLVPLRA